MPAASAGSVRTFSVSDMAAGVLSPAPAQNIPTDAIIAVNIQTYTCRNGTYLRTHARERDALKRENQRVSLSSI